MNFGWSLSPDGFGTFDMVLAALLFSGCVFALPVYW